MYLTLCLHPRDRRHVLCNLPFSQHHTSSALLQRCTESFLIKDCVAACVDHVVPYFTRVPNVPGWNQPPTHRLNDPFAGIWPRVNFKHLLKYYMFIQKLLKWYSNIYSLVSFVYMRYSNQNVIYIITCLGIPKAMFWDTLNDIPYRK